MTNSSLALIASTLLASASPALAAVDPNCASLTALVHQARTDFQSLQTRKFEAGACALRKQEFRCSWSFPSDALAVAEAQSGQAEHCALAIPGVEAVAGKKGETGFTIDDDLIMFVSKPELDMGEWKVRIRLVDDLPPE
ncbi:MAG: hypothetical protein H0W71_01140 [Sphingomonas sp.]|nr:hypothetical protein [Sphingomonas sp.]